MATKSGRIKEAISILADLDMPRAQRNERSALCLLALVNLPHNRRWLEAGYPLMGITPIMDWARDHYDKKYAPNTRETVRRQTMHQFVNAGIALYNPDEPDRSVNSPKAVYQIEPTCLALLQSFGTDEYSLKLKGYMAAREGLATKYAKRRKMEMVPVKLEDGKYIKLSPGAHSTLIRQIWEQFGSRYVPGGQLVYIGDTGDKWGYFDEALLKSLGVAVDNHGKMPDVVMYYGEKELARACGGCHVSRPGRRQTTRGIAQAVCQIFCRACVCDRISRSSYIHEIFGSDFLGNRSMDRR